MREPDLDGVDFSCFSCERRITSLSDRQWRWFQSLYARVSFVAPPQLICSDCLIQESAFNGQSWVSRFFFCPSGDIFCLNPDGSSIEYRSSQPHETLGEHVHITGKRARL